MLPRRMYTVRWHDVVTRVCEADVEAGSLKEAIEMAKHNLLIGRAVDIRGPERKFIEAEEVE